MNKILSIALLIVGVILLIYGLNANNSFASSVSNTVNGNPTDKTIWLIALGALGIILGGGGLLFRRRGNP